MNAPRNDVLFIPASDHSLLLRFGEEISLPTHEKVLKLLKLLTVEPISGVQNIHPAYCSVLVKFDPLKLRHADVELVLKSYCSRLQEIEMPKPRVRKISVCYGGDFGPDLEEVASLHGISTTELIRLHSEAGYRVYFLGFVPGFAYLGGLPKELATPRLASPRKKVPAGSVGIGGTQTGIYPRETPGGWRLIGRTPQELFDPAANQMSFLQIGDEVRFVSIDEEEFRTTVIE